MSVYLPMGVGPTDISKKTTGLLGLRSCEAIWAQLVMVDMMVLCNGGHDAAL